MSRGQKLTYNKWAPDCPPRSQGVMGIKSGLDSKRDLSLRGREDDSSDCLRAAITDSMLRTIPDGEELRGSERNMNVLQMQQSATKYG